MPFWVKETLNKWVENTVAHENSAANENKYYRAIINLKPVNLNNPKILNFE